ncbi:hypothetical protein AAIB41_11535 [Brucella sp. BE17]|uniref:hypothetical protein n=1 Tax=Brucella sp. BE17 TaxID=3142977 RepID=UPI0031B9FC0A
MSSGIRTFEDKWAKRLSTIVRKTFDQFVLPKRLIDASAKKTVTAPTNDRCQSFHVLACSVFIDVVEKLLAIALSFYGPATRQVLAIRPRNSAYEAIKAIGTEKALLVGNAQVRIDIGSDSISKVWTARVRIKMSN